MEKNWLCMFAVHKQMQFQMHKFSAHTLTTHYSGLLVWVGSGYGTARKSLIFFFNCVSCVFVCYWVGVDLDCCFSLIDFSYYYEF